MSESEKLAPLILCLGGLNGEDVAVQVEPEDSFGTFLEKANAILGFDVDINCLTNNEVVNMEDSIYHYLVHAEKHSEDQNAMDSEQIEPSVENDGAVKTSDGNVVYMLPDGTHVECSAIDDDDIVEQINEEKNPDAAAKSTGHTTTYQLVPSSNADFVSQYSDFLEKQNDTTISEEGQSSRRANMIDLLKDAPIGQAGNVLKERTHARKTNEQSQPATECHSCVGHFERSECYEVFIYENTETVDIQTKLTCPTCLESNYEFQTASTRILEADEVVVVRGRDQMIYKRKSRVQKRKLDIIGDDHSSVKIIKTDFKDQNSEEPSSDDLAHVEMLDSTKDQVKDYITVRQEQMASGDLKVKEDFICRFCEKSTKYIALAISHSIHHQNTEKHEFPCTLCVKIFTKFSDVSTHMKIKHKFKKIAERDATSANEKLDSDPLNCLAVEDDDDDDDVTEALRNMFAGRTADQKDEEGPFTEIDLSEEINIKEEPIDLTDEPNLKLDESKVNEEQLVEKLLTEYDATDLDPDILEQLKGNLLKMIRGEDPALKTEYEDDAEYLVDETFDCVYCKKQFSTPLQLTDHPCRIREIRRPGRPRKIELPANGIQKQGLVRIPQAKEKTGDRPFVDDVENDPDWHIDDFEESDHDDEMPPTPPSTEVQKELLEDGLTGKSISCKCTFCGAKFMSKVRLRFHEQFHMPPHSDREVIVYECLMCSSNDPEDLEQDPKARMKFGTEAELFDHVHFGHNKQKSWLCPVASCRARSTKKATFAKHMRTHTGVRRYPCEKCDKRFLDKQTLMEHSVTHMKVKPFQCHICLKHMTRRSRLRIHLRAHESELVTNSVYCCKACKKGFRDVFSAQEHILNSLSCSSKEVPIDEVMVGNTIMEVKTKMEEELLAPDDNILDTVDEDVEEQRNIMLSMLSELEKKVITVARVEKALRCEYCEEVYLIDTALNKHREIHRGQEKPFTCHICKVAFPTYSRVTTHKTTHGYYRRSKADIKREETMFVSGRPDDIDDTEKPENLDEDSRPPVSKDADFPVVKHFLCSSCDKSYLHWTNLQIHRRMKHSSCPYVNKCKLCDQQFSNTWSLAYHRKKAHGITSVTATKVLEEISEDDDDPNKPIIRFSYSCKECGAVLRNKSALQHHMRTAHYELTVRLDTGNGYYTCSECNKQFGSRAGIEQHIKSKHKELDNLEIIGAHTCPQCGKKYAHSSGLYTHIKRIHEQIANHQCQQCQMSFFSRYELDAHRRKHNDERPYLCDICGQAFRTSSVRNEHQRIHSDIRPHKCEICGMAFRRSGALKNHQLIHTGDKKFFCPSCPKRFRIKSDLKTHMKTKHPGQTSQLHVIEFNGLDPNAQQIIEQLNLNKIPPEKVVGLTEVGIPKGIFLPNTIPIGEILGAGTSSLVFDESGSAALIAEGGTLYTGQGSQSMDDEDDEPPPRRGRGIGRGPRRPRGRISENSETTYQVMQNLPMANTTKGNPLPPLMHPTEAILLGDGSIVIKDDPDNNAIGEVEDQEGDEGGQPGIMDEHGNIHLLSDENLIFTEDGHIVIQGGGEDGSIINLEGGAIIRVDEQGRTVIQMEPTHAVIAEQPLEEPIQNNDEEEPTFILS